MFHHQPFLWTLVNSSWSSPVIWDVFWLVISSLVFGYVWIEGMIILFFCHSFVCFIFVILWECWASGGVLKYSGIGESCHATMQIHTNTNSCIYFTIRNVICLIIRVLSLHGSIISNTEHKKSQRNTTEAQFSFFLRVLTARDNQRQHRELIWCSEMWAKIEMSWIAPVVVGEKRKHDRGAQGMHCFCFFEGRSQKQHRKLI